MSIRSRRWTAVTFAVLLAIGAGWWWRGRVSTVPPEGPPGVNALVRIAPVTNRDLPETLTSSAEVTPARPTGLNFAQAGQIIALPIGAGQAVKRGQLIATLLVDPASRLAFVQAQNAVTLTKGESSRVGELFKLRLATQSQVDTAIKVYEDAQAALDTQRQTGGGEARVSLRAPVDGVVTTLSVAAGDRIAAGAPVVQLAGTTALRIRIGIEPAQAGRVKIGTKVLLTMLDQPHASIGATVTEVQNVVDPKTQLVDVIAELPISASAQPVPGMRLKATLVLAERRAATVPREAVLSDEQGDYIFQLDGTTAHRVKVKRGIESTGLVEVTGADDARPVVTLGNYELEEGMGVRIEPR